jgi:hypothetical protein
MHLHENDLILHYYGEMDAAAEGRVATHLAECGECRGSYTRLQRVLAAVESAPVVEPADGFERTVWARLEPNLHRPRRWGWLNLAPGHFAWVAAVLVLVAASFFAGRLVQRTPSNAPTVAADDVRERILLADIGEHLNRSQNVLVELASADGGEAIDLSSERARAEQLVAANRLYRQTAAQSGDAAITELLDEIERVLVDVAAGPARVPASELTDVQRRIDARDLLFKIRVLSAEIRDRQQKGNTSRPQPTT